MTYADHHYISVDYSHLLYVNTHPRSVHFSSFCIVLSLVLSLSLILLRTHLVFLLSSFPPCTFQEQNRVSSMDKYIRISSLSPGHVSIRPWLTICPSVAPNPEACGQLA